MNKRAAVIATMIMVLTTGFVFADGAGGAFWGSQQLSYPGLSAEDSPFSSTGEKLNYVGGMGFGINSDNHVVGGFGVGFSQARNSDDTVSGGFGGLITGRRLVRRPINLMAMLYAGVGGMELSNSEDSRLRNGAFAVMGELTLEASIPILFFHPTFYVGYQVISSVGDGGIGDAYLSYAPTVGFRMLFGGL